MQEVDGDKPKVDPEIEHDDARTLQSEFFLDRVGEVVCVLDSVGLSWKSAETTSEGTASTCLGLKHDGKTGSQIQFDDLYAVEIINHGFAQKSFLSVAVGRLLGHDHELHRFAIHGIQRSLARPCLWELVVHTFGHKDLQTCQLWVNKITTFLCLQPGRPRSLLVFVHPLSGKGNGCKIWESVTPLFTLAKVRTKVIVTNKAGHAFDEMKCLTDADISSYDGVVAVYRERVIFIGDDLTEETSNQILATLLYLDSIDPSATMHFYITGRGGDLTPALTVYDTLHSIKCPIATYCVSYAYGLGAFLLASGTKGKRYAMPLSRIALQPPAGTAHGQADDIRNETEELLRIRDYLFGELAKNTGQPVQRIYEDMRRVKRLTAPEALEYGLIDHIVRPSEIKDMGTKQNEEGYGGMGYQTFNT